MQSPRIWMFNENSAAHRGVWHIIEGELKTTVEPEHVYESDYGVWRNHDRSCNGRKSRRTRTAGKEPYWYTTYEDYWEGCDCELDTDALQVNVGPYRVRHVTPQHIRVRSQPVLCHQSKLNGSTLVRAWGRIPKNTQREVGGLHVITDRIVPLHTYEGELPPGPTCSRCIAKAERDGA